LKPRPRLRVIAPGDPADSFPDPQDALEEPNGLLAVGGDLSPDRLLCAYARGIFPWYSPGEPILWWSPEPRAVLLQGDLHISRRLRRTLRSGSFLTSIDQAFEDVISRCAKTRQATGTWLGPEMISAYLELHRNGAAHSIEVWCGEALAGGLYGVQLGGAFFGESMFSQRPDASKVAMAKLMNLAAINNISLVDCQMPTPHLLRMGVRSLPRNEFLRLLKKASRIRSVGILAAGRGGTADLAG
jgi:leucyl/phenylalanyl-tRNA--protein transferase